MRGTCAVIGMVLLVVFAAHLQREEERRDDEFTGPAMSYRAAAGGASSATELEAERADAETVDASDAAEGAPQE